MPIVRMMSIPSTTDATMLFECIPHATTKVQWGFVLRWLHDADAGKSKYLKGGMLGP